LIALEGSWSDRILKVGRIRTSVIDEYLAVALSLRVQKYGFTSRLTYGRVRGIMDMKIRILDANYDPVGVTWAPDLLEVEAEDVLLCERGDSGSLLVDAGSSGRPRAVGLLCSTSLGHRGYAVPITRTLQFHKAHIVGRG